MGDRLASIHSGHLRQPAEHLSKAHQDDRRATFGERHILPVPVWSRVEEAVAAACSNTEIMHDPEYLFLRRASTR
jgi:hypothetical protein